MPTSTLGRRFSRIFGSSYNEPAMRCVAVFHSLTESETSVAPIFFIWASSAFPTSMPEKRSRARSRRPSPPKAWMRPPRRQSATRASRGSNPHPVPPMPPPTCAWSVSSWRLCQPTLCERHRPRASRPHPRRSPCGAHAAPSPSAGLVLQNQTALPRALVVHRAAPTARPWPRRRVLFCRIRRRGRVLWFGGLSLSLLSLGGGRPSSSGAAAAAAAVLPARARCPRGRTRLWRLGPRGRLCAATRVRWLVIGRPSSASGSGSEALRLRARGGALAAWAAGGSFEAPRARPPPRGQSWRIRGWLLGSRLKTDAL